MQQSPGSDASRPNDSGYVLPLGRREKIIEYLERHARGADLSATLCDVPDMVLEVAFHKARAILPTVPATDRGDSLMWLTIRGVEPPRVLSPKAAKLVGLVPQDDGPPDWADGPPKAAPAGWRNTRRYLPGELPAGWTIVGHRGDGGLLIDTADGVEIVLTCDKRGTKQVLLASLSHQNELPVDAGGVFEGFRGVGRLVEVGSSGGQRFFVAKISFS